MWIFDILHTKFSTCVAMVDSYYQVLNLGMPDEDHKYSIDLQVNLVGSYGIRIFVELVVRDY
eukprot:SAG31_NODE_6396_length_2034_cov_3.180362_2_plen_62_part_00